jgi:biopolymer transport protein ExbD
MKLKKKEQKYEIPTASMADIAFLLIIFFMLTTVFAMSKGLHFDLPKEEQFDSARPEEAIHIQILDDGSLLVDGKPMPLREIQQYIRPKIEVNRTKPTIVQCDPGASYSHFIDVLDELRQLEVDLYPENLDDDPSNDKHLVISIPTQKEIEAWGQFTS